MQKALQNVIVVADHSYINGGQAKVAIDSAIGLADRGLNVSFFSACGPADPRLAAAGVRTTCLEQFDLISDPSRSRAMSFGIWNGKAAAALDNHLVTFDPSVSVLHWHGFAKALSPAVGPIITSSLIPHVYTMHEYFLACPNGGFYDYRSRRICTRAPLGASCLTTNCDVRNRAHKAWRVARQVVINRVAGIATNLQNIIYISRTQQRVISQYLSPHSKLYYLPNPVDVDKAARVLAEENDIFLFIGRLNAEKGGRVFAEAAKLANVRAVFVGEGPEAEAIKAVNPDALITGWLAAEEVEKWLKKSRCLVFPSLWYETFGLVAFEALAKGLPVVCGAWNAAAESIVDDHTGFVYEKSDADTLALALRRMDRSTTKRLSKEAYDAYWSNPLTLTRHVDRLIECYEEVRQPERASLTQAS